MTVRIRRSLITFRGSHVPPEILALTMLVNSTVEANTKVTKRVAWGMDLVLFITKKVANIVASGVKTKCKAEAHFITLTENSRTRANGTKISYTVTACFIMKHQFISLTVLIGNNWTELLLVGWNTKATLLKIWNTAKARFIYQMGNTLEVSLRMMLPMVKGYLGLSITSWLKEHGNKEFFRIISNELQVK